MTTPFHRCLAAALVCALTPACGDGDKDTAPPPDTDTDSDTDADSDSDTDADSDADTDTDTDTGIGPWKETCEDAGYCLADADTIIHGSEKGTLLGYGVVAGEFSSPGQLDIAANGSDRNFFFHAPPEQRFTTQDDATASLVMTTSERLASAGDVNEDGAEDLAVDQHIFCGPIQGELDEDDACVTLQVEFVYEGYPYTTTVGDTNGDGMDDLVAPANGYYSPGVAYLYTGILSGNVSTNGADAELITWDEKDIEPDYPYPIQVATRGAGDTNGDGLDDLIVGATDAYGGDGRLWLLEGPVSGSIQLADVQHGMVGDGHTGEFVDSAGDYNGDGYADVIATNNGDRMTYLLLGPITDTRAAEDADAVFIESAVDDQARQPADMSAGVGNLDADGYDDVAVGTTRAFDHGGAVFIFRGPRTGTISTEDADRTLVSTQDRYEQLGAAIGSGDLDEDGHSDIIIGCESNDYRASSGGAVYIVMGASLFAED